MHKDRRRRRVLIVEDNPQDVFLIKYALDGAGLEAEVTVIDDGSVALDHICRDRSEHDGSLDLIVLDLNLPGLSGQEVLEAARMRSCLDGTAVAILTSSQSPRDRARVAELGVDRYLLKPTGLDDFLALGPVLAQLASRDRRTEDDCA